PDSDQYIEPEIEEGALGAAPATGFGLEAQQRMTYVIEDYRVFSGRPDLEEILHACELRLVQLSYRSFPLYRPIIESYLEVIKDIESGDTEGSDAQLAALMETRNNLFRSGQMVEDIMNLEAATAEGSASGAFDEYLKLFEHLRSSQPERDDAISKYLDRVQAEYK
ncbi:MAG: hypothetical protein ACR2RV_12070, partial [Verrucomicrobiales bacterium]